MSRFFCSSPGRSATSVILSASSLTSIAGVKAAPSYSGAKKRLMASVRPLVSENGVHLTSMLVPPFIAQRDHPAVGVKGPRDPLTFPEERLRVGEPTLHPGARVSEIAEVHAREILDSRGNPTVEVDVLLVS